MTVKIQGTIVSPDYDDAFFGAWIDKGVITPSSRVVSAIEGAEEPIDLYINSYGGDVFAGGEMMIALLKAQAAGKLRTVEVGSLAASMAANIVAALKANGGRVTAHANTQLMYHGCYTVAEGGAQHLEDTADSLRSINEAVITNLNRIGITECRAWFAEGREKWLDATEAQKLASERFASLQAKHDKKISDLTKERDEARASLESVKADLTSSRAEVEKLTADLAQVRDQLAESERNREAVVASALTPTQPKNADGKSARQTLAALPPDKRAEYYKAHKAEIDGINN